VGRAIIGVLRRRQLPDYLVNSRRSKASDVNDLGEVVGVSNTGSAIVPFLWTGKGGPSRIPLLLGDSCGQATAMNRSGHVVGYSSGSKGARAFLWGRNLGLRDLGVLP